MAGKKGERKGVSTGVNMAEEPVLRLKLTIKQKPENLFPGQGDEM